MLGLLPKYSPFKNNSIFCITPFEDFPDIFPSSTDNPPGFVALLAYFYPEIDKH